MPFVVKDDVVPEDMIKKNNRHYKVIMVIIIVTFLLHGLFNGLQTMAKLEGWLPQIIKEFKYTYLLIGLIGFCLSITVGVYLFVAVFKIRSFLLKEGIKQERINVKIMLLHTSSFGLFLFSLILMTITFSLFVIEHNTLKTANPQFYIALTITCISSFTS